MTQKLTHEITEKLRRICQQLRYLILTSTTKAGSGHPTSSLSAVELMTVLFFNGFFYYQKNLEQDFLNDEIIFSKGHAAPLLYSLLAVSGLIDFDDLNYLRQFNSKLEGHPTPRLDFVKVATGSLGQGLSVGAGLALGKRLRLEKNNYLKRLPKIWVLLGDSEMTEGQVWEAMAWAGYYQLSNLVALVDVNRLGQRGETILGWQLEIYKKRAEAFGWQSFVLADGHNLEEINQAFLEIEKTNNSQPKIVLAKTIKGKGVSFLEDQDNWHGKTLNQEQLKKALEEIGSVDLRIEKLTISKLSHQDGLPAKTDHQEKLKKVLSVLEKYV